MSDMGFTPNLIASGTIAPFRLVTLSGAFTGAASNAITDYAVGVSDGSVNAYNGTNHAVSGGAITLQPSNTVELEVGTGGCTAGDFLMCVASSGGTVTLAAGATAKSSYMALQTGSAGEIIRAFRFGYRGPIFA